MKRSRATEEKHMAESDYLSGLREGQGVNVDQQSVHGKAVEGKFSPTISSASGVTIIYDLKIATSHEEIVNALTISGEVRYSGLFSAGVKADFLQSSKVSRYRTFVIARCTVRLPDDSIDHPVLLEDVRKYAATVSRDRFVKTYGTHFLYGIRRGGYYYGVIEVESTSAAEQKDIAVAVSGSGWGVSANAKVAERLNRATEHLSKRVYCFRAGGREDMEQPDSIDMMIQQAANFPKEIASRPIPVSGIYMAYEECFPMQFKEEGGEFSWVKRRDDIGLLGKRYLRLKELRADFEYVVDHYKDYASGTGVVFQLGDNACKGKSLADVGSSQLASLLCESVGTNGTRGSLPLTMENLNAEMAELQDAIDNVCTAADRCRAGDPYEMPAPFNSRISLPAILERNMELERIKMGLVPAGTITMWSGSADAIPQGWQLCDGSVGTPDLRNRFVLGAGGGISAHQAGEPSALKVTTDSSAPSMLYTNQDGLHEHALPYGWHGETLEKGDEAFGIAGDGPFPPRGDVVKLGDGAHYHALPFNWKGLVDTLHVQVGGPGAPEPLRPRWYSLCFIMKV